MAIGHNPWINEVEAINPASEVDEPFQRKTAPPAGRVHNGQQPSTETNGDATFAAGLQSDGQATAHEEEKTALVTAGIAVGLVVLWLLAR